jgi:hypothetical protein
MIDADVAHGVVKVAGFVEEAHKPTRKNSNNSEQLRLDTAKILTVCLQAHDLDERGIGALFSRTAMYAFAGIESHRPVLQANI